MTVNFAIDDYTTDARRCCRRCRIRRDMTLRLAREVGKEVQRNGKALRATVVVVCVDLITSSPLADGFLAGNGTTGEVGHQRGDRPSSHCTDLPPLRSLRCVRLGSRSRSTRPRNEVLIAGPSGRSSTPFAAALGARRVPPPAQPCPAARRPTDGFLDDSGDTTGEIGRQRESDTTDICDISTRRLCNQGS